MIELIESNYKSIVSSLYTKYVRNLYNNIIIIKNIDNRSYETEI